MNQPPIVFVSGLPRSGSTLLMNLLGQNPAHHVTPTNGLLDIMLGVRDNWRQVDQFKSQGVDKIEPRIVGTLRGMVEGFYQDEFRAGKTVFDKSRGWLPYMEMMEVILGRPVNILVTVRDIRAIMASFEKLERSNPITVARHENYIMTQTVEGRTSSYLSDGGTVGMAINRLRDALRRPHKGRILLIPYNQLCRNPHVMLENLHSQLGLPAFRYDPENVQQVTREDDSIHGLPLHNIRTRVELKDETPWKDVLPPALCEALVREFRDIQRYAEAI